MVLLGGVGGGGARKNGGAAKGWGAQKWVVRSCPARAKRDFAL